LSASPLEKRRVGKGKEKERKKRTGGGRKEKKNGGREEGKVNPMNAGLRTVVIWPSSTGV